MKTKKIRNSYTEKVGNYDRVIEHLRQLGMMSEISKTNKITITRSKKNNYQWIITEKYDNEVIGEKVQ